MRVFKFVVLKLAEIGAIILYAELAYSLWSFVWENDQSWAEQSIVIKYFVSILMTTLSLAGLGLLLFGLWMLILLNWEWAERKWL